MRRPTVLVAVLATLLLGLAAPAATAVAPTSQQSSAKTGSCHRTLRTYPVLVPGDRGAAVRTLQCTLNDDGYGPVVVDGWYGAQTRAAVRRVEDGFEGPAPHPGRVNNGFWVLLFGRQLPDRNLALGQHGQAVRALQRALRASGGHLKVNGKFTKKTRRVVRAYQRSQGVHVTGVVDEDTRFFLKQGGAMHGLN
jgi:peptidoglycan hydrolase-like protein with peptidoglycan-binding domain